MSGDERNEGQEGRGFTVIDRRAGSDEAPASPDAASEPAGPPPGVDFSSLCLSLASSALYHLGVAVLPESEEGIPQIDLPVARQTIDTLEMLELKTKGNLDADEARLLESMLYELRMHYVEAIKAAGDKS